jgi:hypothetical protein
VRDDARAVTRIRIPSRRPEDWRRLLADPVKHWRVGYSAYELAHAWQDADEFPPAVAAVLAAAPFGPLELLFAFPEHKVRVPGRGGGSATDLFALGRSAAGELVTVAVEGKVGESFDKPVREWLADPKGNRENRLKRLEGLGELLGVDVADLDDIPYQLLHRAAVALLEAKRFNAVHAVLLIHSFSGERAHLDEYQVFTRLFAAPGVPGAVESAVSRDGVELHLCWVSDQARSQAHAGEPERVLRDALEWLRQTYREHRFFKERDVEAALQRRMTEVFEERRSDWRVFENHRVPGKRLDLAVVDRRRPGEVGLGIELKYEPDHARGGGDMRGDTAKFPVCLREEIDRDIKQLQHSVSEGVIEVGYALLLDEGGYWRTRPTPPQGECEVWGNDTDKRMAPALYVNRAAAHRVISEQAAR